MADDPRYDELCPEREDSSHCQCWWDGEACCSCAAIAMTDEEMAEQGMIEVGSKDAEAGLETSLPTE